MPDVQHFGLILETLAVVSILAISYAIGYVVYQSLRLINSQREITKRLQSERLDHLKRMLASMPQDQDQYQRTITVIEKYLDHLSEKQKMALLMALRQPSERGRRAYAEKLIRTAEAEKEMAIARS
jgi:hypothetical protein